MAIEKQKPLQGVRLKDLYRENTRGWADLSVEERNEFLDKNPELKTKSFKFAANAYDNSRYIGEFGIDAFRANKDKASRDAELSRRYREKVFDELYGDGFGDEEDTENLNIKAKILGLSDESFSELIDSDFEFPLDRKERKDKENNMPSFLRGMLNMHEKGGVPRQKSVSEEWDDLAKETNQDILDRLTAKQAEADRQNAEPVSERILSNIRQMDEGEFDDMYREVVEGDENAGTTGIGVYKSFKDKHEMKDFGPEQKKKLMADYFAILETTKNPVRAEQAITNYLQDYVHEHQTAWDWWGSAMSGIATKTAGDFGNLLAGSHALSGWITYGEDWLNNYLQGLDENGNERGWWDNMKYWNGVDQYNTFDHDAIWEIEKNGGISPYNWISRAGNERNFSSALNEGVKMVGYNIAQVGLSYGLGAAFKGASKLAGGVFTEAGELLAESSKASQAIMKSAPAVISMVNAIPIATAYAKGSYDKVYQEASQRLEMMKEDELNSIFKGVQVTDHGFDGTEGVEGSTDTAATLNALVAESFNELIAEGYDPQSIDLNKLASTVLQAYRVRKKNELDEQYKYLDAEARKEATSAYERNATIEWLRMSNVNYLLKDWQMSKSVRAAKRSSYQGFTAVGKNGEIGMMGEVLGNAINPKYVKYLDMVKGVWGGFESNYMDDVTAAYAQGFSLGRYNNKLSQAFHPERAVAGGDFIAGFTSAISSAGDAFFDPQSWYDGLIGALGTIETIGPRAGMARAVTKTGRTINQYNVSELERYANSIGISKEQYVRGEGYENAVRKRMPEASEEDVREAAKQLKETIGFEKLVKDGTLQKLSVAERLNNYIMNPILQSYSEGAQIERQFRNIIDAGNKAIETKGAAIKDILNVVNALNVYEDALVRNGQLDIHEAKAYKAFTLASLLDSWSKDPIYSQSQFVQEAQAKLERMASGKITDADIAEFLSYNENRDVANQPDAADVARQRLQDNAKELLTFQREYAQTVEDVKSRDDYIVVANTSPEGAQNVIRQLAYNNVMDSNRRERVAKMSEEIGVTTHIDRTWVHPLIYGSEEGRSNAIEQAKEEWREVREQYEKATEKVASAKRLSRRDPLRKLKIKAAELARDEFDRRMDEIDARISMLQDEVDFSSPLSAEDILYRISPSDRAYMLSQEAKKYYSKEQQAEIDRAISMLLTKDPNALQKLQDITTLTEWIVDTEHSNRIFLDNMQAAADYFDYMSEVRAARYEDILERNAWKRLDMELEDPNISDSERIARLKANSIEYINHFLEEHPEMSEALQPAKDLAALTTDIDAAVSQLVISASTDVAQVEGMSQEERNSLVRATRDAYTKIGKSAKNVVLDPTILTEEAAMRALEESVDLENDLGSRAAFDRVLAKVAQFGHQRDATVIRTREQKAQDEEWAKKQERWSDGKNYGFDGYRKGDTIYHQDGRVGVIQRFYKDDSDTGRMVVKWGSNKVETDLRPSDLPKISKEKLNPNDVVVGGWRISKDSSKLPEGYEVGTVVDVYGDGNEYTISGIIVGSSDSQDAVGKVALSSKSKESYMAIPVENLPKSKIIRKPESTAKSEQQSAQTQVKEQKPTVVETPRPETTKTDAELIGESEAVPQFTEEGKIVPKTEEQELAEARNVSEGGSYVLSDTPAEDVANRPVGQTEAGLLEGNGIYRYDVPSLKSDLRVMKLRTGKNAEDTMNAFFNWLDERGIKLQEIIDTELDKIVKADPDTKVQFMVVNKPGVNMHIVEVVEFTPDIEAIHNKELGGVVEVDGKRYLTIGTVFDNHNGMPGFFTIANIVRPASREAFKNGAELYVHPSAYTKVAKIDAGRYVKQQVGESQAEFRTLGQLFADQSRNPNGITFENAIFGIVYNTLQDGKYFVTNRDTGSRKIYPPGKSESTVGRVFLMIPAANGNYVPVALKNNILLSEINDGAFKDAIYDLLRDIASPDLETRRQAVGELEKYLVLDDNTNILVGNEKHNNISVVRGGITVFTREVGANFRMDEFENAVFDTPFKINITQEDIKSTMMLKWLDEAGALQTDVSLLRTVNSAFNVFEIGRDGKPIETQVYEPAPDPQKLGVAKTGLSTVVANSTYRFIEGEYYDAANNVVTDPTLRATIKYNLEIQRSGLKPAIVGKSGAEIFIINDSPENPIVIKRNPDKTMKFASEEEAIKTILQVREKVEADRRVAEAEEALKQAREEALRKGEFESVPEWDDSGMPPVPEPAIQSQEPAQSATTQETKEAPKQTSKSDYDAGKATRKSLAELEADKKVTNFGSLYSQKRAELNEIAKEKGWNWGKSAKEKEAFLREKLGTAYPEVITDVSVFMDLIKNCK